MLSNTQNPLHWRKCAAEMRILAEQIENSDARAIFLRLAKDYDWLADWANVQRQCSAVTSSKSETGPKRLHNLT